MLVSDLRSIGMKLHSKPRAPSRHELAMKAGKMLPRKVHPTWQPYLSSVMDEEDENETDYSRPTPDLRALGIVDNNGNLVEDDAAQPKKKKMSKNQRKRRAKKSNRMLP